MILLDTNVVSELTRSTPNARVMQWLEDQQWGDVWICAINVAEMRLGVAVMPEGKRKRELADSTARILAMFKTCVAFDALAATEFADVVASRRKAGRAISYSDAQIAGIARSATLTLATRNTKDFSDIEGLTVIDPWGPQINTDTKS